MNQINTNSKFCSSIYPSCCACCSWLAHIMAHHPSLLIVPAFLLADDATFSFLFCSPSTHFCISLSGWDLAKSLPARFIFPNSKILLASRVRHLLMPLPAGQFCQKSFVLARSTEGSTGGSTEGSTGGSTEGSRF